VESAVAHEQLGFRGVQRHRLDLQRVPGRAPIRCQALAVLPKHFGLIHQGYVAKHAECRGGTLRVTLLGASEDGRGDDPGGQGNTT
jgi:hypothetical protein